MTSLAGELSALALICLCLVVCRRIEAVKTNSSAPQRVSWKCFSKSCVQCLPAAHLKTEFWQAIIIFISVQMSPIAQGGPIFIYLCLVCIWMCACICVTNWACTAPCLCGRSKGWSIMGSFLSIPGILACDSEWYLHFFYLKIPCCNLPAVVSCAHVGCLLENDCFMQVSCNSSVGRISGWHKHATEFTFFSFDVPSLVYLINNHTFCHLVSCPILKKKFWVEILLKIFIND